MWNKRYCKLMIPVVPEKKTQQKFDGMDRKTTDVNHYTHCFRAVVKKWEVICFYTCIKNTIPQWTFQHTITDTYAVDNLTKTCQIIIIKALPSRYVHLTSLTNSHSQT